MSAIRTITVYKKVIVHIRVIDPPMIMEIEDALKKCIIQKLDKLKIVLGQCNIYSANNCMLVNDRYGVLQDIEKIVKAFGMDIVRLDKDKMIECNNWGVDEKIFIERKLKGKNYIISDTVAEMLKIIATNYELGIPLSNMESNNVVSRIIDKFKPTYAQLKRKYDVELTQYIRQILDTGKLDIEGTESISVTDDDGIVLEEKSLGVKSNEDAVVAKLEQFVKNIDEQLNQNDRNMMQGTTELLYARARQMGYSVEKVEKGDTIQLVLVRV